MGLEDGDERLLRVPLAHPLGESASEPSFSPTPSLPFFCHKYFCLPFTFPGLFHIYLRTHEPSANGSRPPTFEEFCESIELLDQRTKTFAKQATELIQELRKLPDTARRTRSSGVILLLLVLGAFATGVAIGKFAL